jgi:hypothetical protein
MFLGLGITIFSIVFDDRPMCWMIRPMISFGTRKIDKKMLTFLSFPRSNTAGTLLVADISNTILLVVYERVISNFLTISLTFYYC